MNIYLMVEDGSSFCAKGKTMAEAILFCEKSYIADAMEDNINSTEDSEKQYYHEEILESCTLIGNLVN